MLINDKTSCGPKSIKLWTGEKDSISNCKRECDDDEQCKFMFYGDSCTLYYTCENSEVSSGKTYHKVGTSHKKYLLTNTCPFISR